MSEMLANHYYMNHKYFEAARLYNDVLKHNADNYDAKKKLIPCLIKLGEINKAFELYYDIIKYKPNLIAKNNHTKNCPCLELLNEIENEKRTNLSIKEFYLALAILWSYCNINNSIRYFELVQTLTPECKKFQEVLLLISKINTNN
jgi:tetratricopeptide (TPR) repeat protein